MGALVWRWRSDGFGEEAPDEDVDGDGTEVVMNIRFPGQYYDAETGLHYNRFRYYDPSIGRYISADPIGQAGGVNLYRYAMNDPANMIDPFGLVSLSVEVFGGLGGRITVGIDNSTGEFFGSGGVGVGLGGGFEFDLDGAPPGADDAALVGPESDCDEGVNAGAGFGPLGVGTTKEAGFNVDGNGRLTGFNEQSSSGPGNSFGIEDPRKAKGKIGASVTVNFNFGTTRTPRQQRFKNQSQ